MIACAPDNTAKKTNDPIENLIAYLDEQDEQYANRSIEYEGGRFLKTTVNYFIFANKSASVAISPIGMRRAEKTYRAREEVIDSCFRAFRWGCSSARQCYHKENHVMDKDTVLYALGLDALDGEKIELEGVGSNDYLFMAHYKAARAATMKYRADKEKVAATIEYIIREETGKEEKPFDMTPIMDFINKKVADTDSAQVYETAYECSAEDWNTVKAIWLVGTEDLRDGITKGHLYVFPEADSRLIQDEFTRYVKDKYLSKYGRCNQKFRISMDHTYTGETLEIWPSPLMTGEIKSNFLYSGLSQDGKFHILVIDEIRGAFFIPSSWKHLIRFQNHKAEYIPGTENREYWD